MLVQCAAAADLDAVAPLFDAYRQFYGQRSDLAAARVPGRAVRRDESVILNDLIVRAGVRRSGVGRRLLERAREWAIETDAKGLTARLRAPAQSVICDALRHLIVSISRLQNREERLTFI